MKFENRVNELNGTQWLKNAVNFWLFDNYNVFDICSRFKNFCYKDRTGSGVLENINKISEGKSDFSFSYVKNIDNAQSAIRNILNGAYNSYHIIYFESEIIDGYFLCPFFTKNLDIEGIEFRGKFIISSEKNTRITYSLLFLNRVNKEIEVDLRNNLFKIENNLDKPYIIESKSKIDKIGLSHPAPYSYLDIKKICEIDNIKNKLVLDPFLGVGSTIIGTYESNRNIGIELNKKYIDLIFERYDLLGLPENIKTDNKIICGDSLIEIDNINEKIDSVITSPPYFNILKNKSSGVRTDNSQSRQGVEYYSDSNDDIGNIDNYSIYLDTMKTLFKKIHAKMNKGGTVHLIISDFTVNKKEKDIHSDFVNALCEVGYAYKGTSYILQNQKAIYPFGYPFKLVINHIFQYIVRFEAI